MLWLDRRALSECEKIREDIGEDYVLSVSGNRIDPAYCVPKMRWLQNHKPDVYQSTYKFLQSNSYIVYRLTGEFTQDVSQGYGYYVFDIEKRDWSEEALERFRLDPDLLPAVFESDTIVGQVTRQAAEATGLVPGIPVIAGGVDCAAACLGADITEHLETQEQAGQAGGMTICTDRPYRDSRLISGCHVLRDRWHLSGGTVSGGVLNWIYQRVLGAGFYDSSLLKDRDPFELLSEDAAQAEPGCGGLIFLPYMAGERTPIWDPLAKGVFVGLSYEKQRPEIIRALMEGAALALRHNLEVAASAGAQPASLVSVGGGSKSAVWCQIKADVAGVPLGVPNMQDGTVFGAAFLAGIGVGAFDDYKAALKQTVKVEKWYEPRLEHKELYDELYEAYLMSYESLKPVMHKLAKITEYVKGSDICESSGNSRSRRY
jgi:xylulokinase